MGYEKISLIYSSQNLGWVLGKALLTVGVVKCWKELPRELVASLALKIFKNMLDKHLSWMVKYS